ncbi:MAG TPA: PKD domain-containing protein [Methanospirillum sp.]|uniref:PKD domain-containing protein n=1 Tax=Methanospirillum sp. TaxID=45200 RepID=UPI002C1F4092|nr:PKD domain-containing protein [Methanospirillum sp.]HOJ95484.1 PKD domain-containing protein [Methanospirillum sp.]
MGNRNNCWKYLILFIIITGFVSVQGSALKADAQIGPIQGTAPLNVMYTDTSVGKPIEWHWDFGDGYTGDGPRTMHTYMAPGIYTVSLLVIDSQGASDTAVFKNLISVSANPFMPVIPIAVPSFSADFTGGPQTGPAPLAVSFTDMSKGEPKTWVWDFGDGTTSNDKNPVHIYSSPGTYTVILKISKDSSTGMKERKNYITVTAGSAIPDNQGISSAPVTPSSVSTPVQSAPISDISEPEPSFMMNTVSDTSSTCDSRLSVISESESVQSGENIQITITGDPLEKVYFWITSNGTSSETFTYPLISDEDMIFDHPEGPYTIGSFIPDKKSGTSLSELTGSNQTPNATGLYGLMALDKNGTHTVTIDTSKASPGVYSMNAISGESMRENDCMSTLQVTIL